MGHDLTDDLIARIDELVDNPTQRAWHPTADWSTPTSVRFATIGRSMHGWGAATARLGQHMITMRQAIELEAATQRVIAEMMRRFTERIAENPSWWRDLVHAAREYERTRPVPVKRSARTRYQRRTR